MGNVLEVEPLQLSTKPALHLSHGETTWAVSVVTCLDWRSPTDSAGKYRPTVFQRAT